MTQEEIALSNEIVLQLIDDMKAVCLNARDRLSGRLLPDHVANAAMCILIDALYQYRPELKPLMIGHVISQLKNQL